MDVEARHEQVETCEEALIAKAMAGNLSAFDELVRLYRPGLAMAISGMLQTRESVEDVVQDTFLLAFRTLPQLREPAKFGGWLFAIAKHRAVRASKRDRRERPVDLTLMERTLVARSESMTDAQDDRWPWILAQFASLPEDIRQCADLHYLRAWPIAKIADSLGITETTVKWRLHRCRELIRRKRGPAGGTNHAC